MSNIQMVRASEFLSGIPMIVKNQLIMVKYSDGFNDHLNTGTEFGVFYGSDAVQISNHSTCIQPDTLPPCENQQRILKATPANPRTLAFSVIKIRTDRGQLICSKTL